MSQEKIHIRTWPVEKTLDFFGSGVDADTIRSLNDHGSEEAKRRYIHERRKDTLINSAAFLGLIGTLMGAGYGLKELGVVHPTSESTPIEQTAAHHGVTHNIQPGTGVLHTKSGDFRVTQR